MAIALQVQHHICYEIAYSDVIRHKLPAANLLLTMPGLGIL
jgi:apolipoprotein N-acyltransferase